jgi:PAS domain S-box-containing protein
MRLNKAFWSFIVTFCILGISPAVSFPSQQINVQPRQKVVVAVLPNFAPIFYRDARTGKAVGFAIDMMNEVAGRAGLQVEYIFGKTWTELENMVESGKADVIPEMTVNKERLKRFIFTRPVENLPFSYVIRNGQNVSGPTSGMRVGVMLGTASQNYLANRKDIILVPEQGLQKLLLDLLSGKIDLILTAVPHIMKIAIDAGIDDRIKVLEPPAYMADRSMALRLDDKELRGRLDQSLGNFLGNATHRTIYERWWGKPKPYWTIMRVVIITGLVLLAIVILLGSWFVLITSRLNRKLTQSLIETQQVQGALIHSQEELKAIYNHAPVMMCLADQERHIVYANKALAEFIGVTEETLRGGFACGVFGCINALDDPTKCGLSQNCQNCAIRLSIEDTYKTGIGHSDFEHHTTLVRDGNQKDFVLLGSTALINTGDQNQILLCLYDITERKRAEEVLQDNKAKLQAIFDTTGAGVFIIDRDTQTIIEANQTAIAMTGFSRDRIIGQLCHSLVCPALIGKCPVKDLGQQIDHSERKLLHADGGIKDILKTVHPITIEGRECYIESFIDITERKQVEQKLLEQESKLESIFRVAPVGIGMLIDRVFQETNDMLCLMTGYSREELIGQKALMLYASREDYDYVGQEKYSQIRQKGTGTVETHWKKKDGTVIDILLSSTPLDPDDLGKGVTFTALDITDRKQAEEVLLEERRQLGEMIEYLPDATFVIDADRKVIAWNRAIEQMTGIPKGKMIGKGNYEYTIPFYGERRPILIDLALLSEEDFLKAHYDNIDRQGSVLSGEVFVPKTYGGRGAYLWGTASILFNTNGKIIGAIESIRDITDRKAADEALRNSESRFKEMSDLLPEALFEANMSMRLTFVNKKAITLFGYTEKELTAEMNCIDMLVPRDRERARENVAKRMAGIDTGVVEYTALKQNGSTFPVLISATSIKQNGKPVGLRGIIIDITERKKTEEALQESELFSSEIQRIARLGGWKANPHSDYLKWTDGVYDIIEAPPDYQPNLSEGIEVFQKDYIPVINSNLSRCLATGEPFTIECEVITFTGKKLWAEVRGLSPIIEGERSSVMGTFQDITDRKEAEEKLNNSEARFRNLLQSVQSVAVQGYGPDTKTQYWNKASEMFYGYTAEEAIGRSLIDLIIPPEMQIDVEHDIRQMVETGQPIPAAELSLMRKDGSRLSVYSNHAIVQIPGRAPELFCIDIDLTDRKKAEEDRRQLEERLQRSEKMEALGLLSGGVAHDLNNVLGILVGYSELLRNRIEESSPLKPYATNIMMASERAAAIVQDMLTLARRGVQDRKAINLNTLILDFLKAPECEAITTLHPNVELKANLGAELLPIMGAPAQLDKTIMNLVSNAADAMPKGGLVTITTDNQYLDGPVSGYDEMLEGDYVVLSVSDQGEGIPANDIKHIFEPFYTKKVMGKSGTGLGLAVVWGTVKDHNGYIDIWSKEGKGSTFSLYFPATREKISAETAPKPISEYVGHGESILVVDDVQGQRDLAAEMLRGLNYNVTVASSGEEAVAYLKDHTVDLLVLDMIMDPGIDGLETYKRIIAIYPRQKAIIVSGFSETDKVKLAQELGAGNFVRKPYVLERLGMAVRKELERK